MEHQQSRLISNGSGTSSLEVLEMLRLVRRLIGTEASPQAGRIIYHNNDDSLSHSNTGGEKLRITDGKIGIGTVPDCPLEVNNPTIGAVGFRVSNAGGTMLYISNFAIGGANFGGANINAPPLFMELLHLTKGQERLRITSTGNVGIETDTISDNLEVLAPTNASLQIKGGAAGSDANEAHS